MNKDLIFSLTLLTLGWSLNDIRHNISNTNSVKCRKIQLDVTIQQEFLILIENQGGFLEEENS